MNEQDPFKVLDQRTNEAAAIMDRLTAEMAKAQAEVKAIHAESEALKRAAEEVVAAAAAKAAQNYRTSGRVRFHKRGENYSIRVYAPGLPYTKTDKMTYLGQIFRRWFVTDEEYEEALEKFNGYMETTFQTGVDYQREVIALGLDRGTGRSHSINTSKEVQPTSMQTSDHGEQGSTGIIGSLGIDVGPGVDIGPGTSTVRKRRPADTKDDAIGRLFNGLVLEDQAVVTAFYMPSGVTAEKLLAKNRDKSMSIRTMALRNPLRAYFRKNPDREFTVAKARDILQIHKQDNIRAANRAIGEAANPGNDLHGQVGTRG